ARTARPRPGGRVRLRDGSGGAGAGEPAAGLIRGAPGGPDTRYPCPLRMTLPAPTYDLMLLLDPQAEETTRSKIVADALNAIEAQGELVNQAEWGERPLAYPIDRKASADYRLIQFHVGETALLEGLDRTLRITDGVLRHRIIKLAPGTPSPPEMTAQRRSEAPEAGAPEAAPAAPAPAAEAPSEPVAEQAPPVEPAEQTAQAEAPAAEAEPAGESA